MRPVTKGKSGQYRPKVDVSNQAALDASLAAYPVDFKGKAAKPVTSVFGVASPTAEAVLDGLLRVAVQAGKPPPTKKVKTGKPAIGDILKIRKTLAGKLSDIYGTAAGLLGVQLGRFCSFCEQYVPTGPAVEHVAPKSQYPLFYVAWDNFLLACPVCNSIKRERPLRDDKMFTPKPADEVEYFKKIKDRYLWPQWYAEVYRDTKPRLEYEDAAGTWRTVTYPVEPGTMITRREETERIIYGKVYTVVTTAKGKVAKWLTDVPLRVVVRMDTNQAVRMVEKLVNLNRISDSGPKYGGQADIRVWTRTEQWFKVLTAATILEGADKSTFQNYWTLIMGGVQQPGFYSVWVRVLELHNAANGWYVPGVKPKQTVMEKFLAEIVAEQYFPGTDTDDTP